MDWEPSSALGHPSSNPGQEHGVDGKNEEPAHEETDE